MVALLYLMVDDYYELQVAGERASDDTFTLQITMALWGFLFGVLMEWKGLEKLISREFTFNWKLLIPTVVLAIFVFIPNIYWVIWFGISENFYLNIFLLPETHMISSVLAGNMLVRSFAD
ncbi:hypothetical protein [Virgibacillus ndiopensis]|uniref:hypothetical protein n=1 Tax=Virgibacillus ndiopensis TaxID=2004408 RepID=UPI000C071E34|nr:hypothetical protein [Virgibacillus ndiopensis]